ncbi:MAG: ABC transporter ATP-binding protein [Aquabacterium sp.]|nr:ABC transporter ATP-binding protein [Aquabacterium sp.]
MLRIDGITKRFGALVANDAISLTLSRGEVLALLGENGAGKSTLVSILFGHYLADAGRITVDGQPLAPGNPAAALAAGIGMVHQHFTLADNLSVLDNVMLGTEPLWQPFSRRKAARQALADTAQRFGLQVDPEARIADLSVGERQRVEILKALLPSWGRGRKAGARILILDEPTAVLTPQESESLFATLGQLVAQGLAIIFIGHKLDEVLRVSHRIAVLRGGKLVAEMPAAGASKAQLAQAMVGRDVQRVVREAKAVPAAAAAPVCTLQGVTVRGHGAWPQLDNVSLALQPGEVVAIAGVAGNGQHTLADLLHGLVAPDAGTLTVAGRALPATPRAWVDAGVARIPEDRHAVGVVGDLPLWENAVLERSSRPAFARWGLVRRAAARAFAQGLVTHFDVRGTEGSGLDTTTRSLSGGNMQKLILGRALTPAPRPRRTGGDPALGPGAGDPPHSGPPMLIVANQPTWGLDIGAVAYVHRQLLDACAQGAALLLISEDLDEIFALADRIAVMHHGQLSAALPVADWTLPAIGLAMAGSSGAALQEGAHAA